MRIGYLECFSGICGDMLLGALVDAGVPFGVLTGTASALNVGARLEMRKVSRGGLAAIKVDVLTEGQRSRDQGAGVRGQNMSTATSTAITPTAIIPTVTTPTTSTRTSRAPRIIATSTRRTAHSPQSFRSFRLRPSASK